MELLNKLDRNNLKIKKLILFKTKFMDVFI